MTGRVEYSPPMLRLFLHARAVGRERAALSTEVRRAANVTVVQFDMAWTGRLCSAAPRLAIWRALGVDPAADGVRLVDGGGQEGMA